MLAVDTGSAPVEVGASVEPNTETMSLIPAAAYCDLIVFRASAPIATHSSAWSKAPSVRRKDKALCIQSIESVEYE